MHWPLLPSPGALLNEPSEHGSGALLPASQYEPATQSKHAVWPLSFMNLPATHALHSDCLSSGLTVPGLHGVASALPMEHHVPSSHVTHWLSSLITGRLALRVPAGHGSGALEPCSQ